MLLLFSFSLSAQESGTDIAHPFYLLKADQIVLEVKNSYFEEEHEYEKAKVVQDLFENTHWSHQLSALFGLSGQRQVGFSLHALSNGKLYKEYSPSLNLPSENLNYHGLHAVEVYFQEHFKTESNKNKLAIEFHFKGSPLKGKETNNTYSGKDFSMSLHYSHLHNDLRFYGELKSQVYGRKKTKKFNGEIEIINSYSEFGNSIGLQWLKGDFWYEAELLFALTTDYHSNSLTYDRFTDKGFVTGGKLLLGYRLTPQSSVWVEHLRRGASFNVISGTANATEFEIETQYTQLGIKWLF